jgi:hypothetical protein
MIELSKEQVPSAVQNDLEFSKMICTRAEVEFKYNNSIQTERINEFLEELSDVTSLVHKVPFILLSLNSQLIYFI